MAGAGSPAQLTPNFSSASQITQAPPRPTDRPRRRRSRTVRNQEIDYRYYDLLLQGCMKRKRAEEGRIPTIKLIKYIRKWCNFETPGRKVRGCKWGMSHLHLCKDSQGKYPLSREQEVAEILSLIQSRKARSCPASQQPHPPSLNLDCDDDI